MSGFDDVGKGYLAPVPDDVRSSEMAGPSGKPTVSLRGPSTEGGPQPYAMGSLLPRKSSTGDNFRQSADLYESI